MGPEIARPRLGVPEFLHQHPGKFCSLVCARATVLFCVAPCTASLALTSEVQWQILCYCRQRLHGEEDACDLLFALVIPVLLLLK